MTQRIVSRIRDLRSELNLTQRQLADAIGVTESTIRNWESGRNGVEWLDRVAKLCSVLGCSAEDLIEVQEDKE